MYSTTTCSLLGGFQILIKLSFSANLSEDYFTDRQDRCYVIQDCEPLANYFEDLISMRKKKFVSKFNLVLDSSFNVNESGNLVLLP